ncbi:hypothetical protein B9G55_11395 [Saccharibacillus sp. O16]|nr:hypothetical protein B9G55_11395 [Saccharibacillus sp. O16]
MFRKIVPLLIGAAAGLVIAWAAISLLGSGEAGRSSAEPLRGQIPELSGAGPIALLVLVVALLVMVTILLHEVGHMLGAVAVGSRITRLYWGPLIFRFPERSVRFDLRSKFFFGAMQCDMQPYHDEASFARAIRAQRVVYAAGPAFSLVTGLVAWLLAPGLWSLAGGYALFSVGIGLATLMSDGVNALMLGRRSFALVSAWSMLMQEEQLDESRRAFLMQASLQRLGELAAQPVPSQGRQLHDLYLLYDVKLMRGERQETTPEQTLTQEALSERVGTAKRPKMRRDALDLVLGEEVVRLCEAERTEEADALYAQLGGRESVHSPMLLKARAYMERSEAAVREYEASLTALRSDAGSFGAFRQLEEQRLQQAGLM